MGELQRRLVSHLLQLSDKEKRLVGNRIVKALGGIPDVKVTGLPPRRGPGDGGIDGRIPIIIKQRTILEKLKFLPDGTKQPIKISTGDFEDIQAEAAFQIKIEKEPFDRYDMNTFVEDMRREGIFAGIIVTASGLSPDAECELKRHNKNDMDLCHILLEDFLSSNFNTNNICFIGGNIEQILCSNLREFLSNN